LTADSNICKNGLADLIRTAFIWRRSLISFGDRRMGRFVA
jgi:hypothetical protein